MARIFRETAFHSGCTVYPLASLIKTMAIFVPSPAAALNPPAFYAVYEYHRTDTEVLMADPRIPANSLESTQQLLDLVRQGDRDALERLFARCLPPLRRWARAT